MQNGRSHIRDLLRHLHVQDGRRRRKTFETYFTGVMLTIRMFNKT